MLKLHVRLEQSDFLAESSDGAEEQAMDAYRAFLKLWTDVISALPAPTERGLPVESPLAAEARSPEVEAARVPTPEEAQALALRLLGLPPAPPVPPPEGAPHRPGETEVRQPDLAPGDVDEFDTEFVGERPVAEGSKAAAPAPG